MRPRRRAASLLVGAAVLYLIGTNAQAGWLFVLSALLLGAAGAGTLLPAAGLRRLEVEIVAPRETRQGEPTSVSLRISNRGRATRWAIVVRDAFLGGATSWVGSVRPGEVVTIGTVRHAPRRGEALAGWVELRTSAPFGVAERRRRFAVDGATLVLPRSIHIGAPTFIESSPARQPSLRSEPRRGGGPEYLGVREYRPGDPIRQVHWRLSARHGELVVRDLEEARMPRLVVWLDTASGAEELDRSCTIAASLVDAVTATGAGVRLLATGPQGPIGASRARAIDLHRWLARLEGTDVDAEAGLARVDAAALRGAGTIVIVPADRAVARLEREIGRIAGEVRRVIVVVHDEATDTDSVERRRRLSRVGAHVWSWRGASSDPIAPPLEVGA